MTANLELDLEERLALLHGGRGRADGCRQVRVALALLLSQPGSLGAIGLCACFLSLALAPFCIPLLSTLEHRVPPISVISADRTEAMVAIPDICGSESRSGGAIAGRPPLLLS